MTMGNVNEGGLLNSETTNSFPDKCCKVKALIVFILAVLKFDSGFTGIGVALQCEKHTSIIQL